MSTPKEIIEELAEIVIETRIVQDDNFATKDGKDLEKFFISKMISEYEEMLNEDYFSDFIRAKLKAWRDLIDNK